MGNVNECYHSPSSLSSSSSMNPVNIKSVYSLSRHWQEDLDEWDARIQGKELKYHKNADVKECGITRTIITTDDQKRLPSIDREMRRIVDQQPFTPDFCRVLFSNIHMVFMGDSLARGMYKDMVTLIDTRNGDLVYDRLIKKRGERSWCNDRRIQEIDDSNKTKYVEYREYLRSEHWIQYLFTTRIFNERVTQLLAHFEQHKPDVVVIHSNIWDATRYSHDDRVSLTQFILRLSYLCQRLKQILDPNALVIYVLLPPAAYEQATGQHKKKGFWKSEQNIYDGRRRFSLHEQNKEDTNRICCFTQLAINYYAAQIMASYGFDVLDLNYHFQQDLFAALRCPDGLHYSTLGIRIMNQMLIGHIIKAWEVELPSVILYRQAEHFDNNHVDLPSDEDDILEQMPDCYRYLFKINKEMFEKLKKRDSYLIKIIENRRKKLMYSMIRYIKDPHLNQFNLKKLLDDELKMIAPLIINLDEDYREKKKKKNNYDSLTDEEFESRYVSKQTKPAKQFLSQCITKPEDFDEIWKDLYIRNATKIKISLTDEELKRRNSHKPPEDQKEFIEYLINKYY